jgi:hypothetical protein
MSTNLTWPFVPNTVGGIEQIVRRVEEAQARGNLASFSLVEVGRKQKLKAEFFRQGFYVHLEFLGNGINGLALVSADVRRKHRGKNLWITLTKARHSGGRIGVAFDHDRGYMVAFDREGNAENIGLPFTGNELKPIPRGARGYYCLSACSLATWAAVLLIGLCRYDQAKLREIVKIVKDLRGEVEGQLDELMVRYDLEPGTGFTKLRMETTPSRWR